MAGLDASIGLSALLASQRGMDVVGHNIANASTPGYTRQSAELVTATPTRHPIGGQMGTGVRVAMVRQVADAFLNGRVRVADATNGYDTALAQRLSEVEGILGDSSEGGLGGLLSGFASAADALAVTPDDPSTRVTFLASAERLAEGFQTTANFVEGSRASINGEVEGLTEEVNQLAARVAELNLAILNVEGSGQQANDLRDQRGTAARRLARLVGAKASQQADGALKVTVAGKTLLAGVNSRRLEVRPDSQGNAEIFFEGVGSPITLQGGEAGGLQAAQQETSDLLSKIDRLAQSLIREANRIHATGVPGSGPYTILQTTFGVQDTNLSGDPGDVPLNSGGLAFQAEPTTIRVNVTDPSGAVTTTPIALDPNTQGLNDLAGALTAIPGLSASVSASGLLTINAAAGFSFDFADRSGGDNDPGGVLAAIGANPLFQGSDAATMSVASGLDAQGITSGLGPGQSDGRNAMRLSGMAHTEFADLDGEDLQGFLAVIVSQAGQATRIADDRAQASERVMTQLDNQREGVSGVSMEEEVANMIRFQRSFEAASRYLSVLNGLSDELMRMVS